MSRTPRVCAVLVGSERVAELLAALRGQSRPLDDVVVARELLDNGPGLKMRQVVVAPNAGVAGAAHAGLRGGLAEGADWLWLLDGSAVPDPEALERLLDVLDDLGELPTPALLASTVVTSEGEPHPAALPVNRLTHKEVVIEACRRRLVSVRAARHGSLLVSRAALERDGLPRADYVADGDDLEWTARLLRDADGYLVPSSRVVRRDVPAPASTAPSPPTARGVRNALDMLCGQAWSGEEKLWVGFLVMADLGRGLRANPRAAGHVARGLSAGLWAAGERRRATRA